MTPEQISIIAAILDKIGTWPISTLVMVIVVGPWLMFFFISRGQEKRFEAVREMYENNVKLVEVYEKLACEQQDTIIMNTGAITKLTTIIEERLR